MPRRVRGVLALEGVQTGDGRVIAAGALEWADLPLPLGWLQEEQHGDLLSGAVQIGTIDTITRSGQEVPFVGTVDDGQEDGAEMVRRLEAGTAPLGTRWGISIDPDDYELQVVATGDPEEDEDGMLLASAAAGLTLAGRGTPPSVAQVATLIRPAVTAAAGDPDVAEGEGVVLFEDAVDAILMRFTRLRIRGATACAIAAFDGAFMELDGEAEDGAEGETAPVAASAAPLRPPSAWFSIPEPLPGHTGMVEVYGMPAEELLVEQPDGGLGVPLTITDDGRVFGHAALWGQCHVGYGSSCVSPPQSMAAYAHFHVGSVVCDDGQTRATGVLTVGCDHATASAGFAAARDHYAHSGTGWADVRATNGELGVWVSGVLRPEVTETQLRVLRALSLSGDWRSVDGNLEFIAALAVNVPGFPIAREAIMASGLAIPEAHAVVGLDAEMQPEALVASGVVHRCADCARRAALAASALDVGSQLSSINEALVAIQHGMRTLDHRTRHLAPAAAEHALGRVRGNGLHASR